MRGKSRWLKILSVLVIVAILVASVLRGKVFFSESDEFIEKMGHVPESTLRYLGVAVCGSKKKVNKLTGSMPLLR